METWKPIPGFDAYYEASNLGRIRSRYRVLKQSKTGQYMQVTLSVDGQPYQRLVHRLVLEAFAGARPSGYVACHFNGDGTDNRLENLRWGTYTDNNGEDKERTGRLPRGERNGSAKLTEAAVRSIREDKDTISAIARKFQVSGKLIREIKKGNLWKHVS